MRKNIDCRLLAVGFWLLMSSSAWAAYDGARAFGLHFDFHASPAPYGEVRKVYGALTEDDVRTICRTIKPDFIQVDSKGHHGYVSYLTKLGNAVPGIAQDGMALWRRVTREEGVGLYVHYSGVADRKYFTDHPEEAVKGADGWPLTGERATRPNGRYVDDLLIPQLKELAGVYGVDGAWIDGECWAARVDYDPRTLQQFEQETGIKLNGVIPVGDKPYHREYMDFCRTLFGRYLNHYVDEIHKVYPKFRITSNWAFTDVMPVEVSANVDYISGDLASRNSIYSAMLSGRAAAQQGKPWDLMAWEFRWVKKRPLVKSPGQLCQEAAAVISLGGGYQMYITQRWDGQPRMARILALKPVAEFVRARQPFCFGGQQERQVAILLSTEDFLATTNQVYRCGVSRFETMADLALFTDSGFATSVIMDHHLKDAAFDVWPVVVVPEVNIQLASNVVERLLAYARAGGSLVLDGSHACEIFANAGAPLKLDGTPSDDSLLYTLDGAHVTSVRMVSGLAEGGEVIARLFDANTERDGKPLAAIYACGKGKIAAIAGRLGESYMNEAQFAHRDLVRAIVKKLYRPLVEVEKANGLVHIVPLKKDGKRMIQIVNANGRHRDEASMTEDFISPAVDIALRLNLGQKPAALTLQPANRKLSFEWRDGAARVTLPRVDLHDIIVVEE